MLSFLFYVFQAFIYVKSQQLVDDGMWEVSDNETLFYDDHSGLLFDIEFAKRDNHTEKIPGLMRQKHFIDFMVSYAAGFTHIDSDGNFTYYYGNYTHSANVRYAGLKNKRFDVSFCVYTDGLVWLWHSHFRVFRDTQSTHCGLDYYYPGCRSCGPHEYWLGCNRAKKDGFVVLAFVPFRRTMCMGRGYDIGRSVCNERNFTLEKNHHREHGPGSISPCRRELMAMDHDAICGKRYKNIHYASLTRREICGDRRIVVYTDGDDHFDDRFAYVNF